MSEANPCERCGGKGWVVDHTRRWPVSPCPVCGDRLAALEAEVARLRDGRLTPEEFHALCHHLHERGTPCTRQEFEAGCRAFADKLFPPEG